MKTFKNKFETWIFNEAQRFFIYKTTIKKGDEYYEWRYSLPGAVNGQTGLELITCGFKEDIPVYDHLLMFYKEPWSMISEDEAKKLKIKLIKSLFKIKR